MSVKTTTLIAKVFHHIGIACDFEHLILVTLTGMAGGSTMVSMAITIVDFAIIIKA